MAEMKEPTTLITFVLLVLDFSKKKFKENPFFSASWNPCCKPYLLFPFN